jgi:hypothetical protein
MTEAQAGHTVERKEMKYEASLPCMSGDRACACRVVQLVDDSILTVAPSPEMKCTHKMRYRDAYLCTSPVRREAYKRHKI